MFIKQTKITVVTMGGGVEGGGGEAITCSYRVSDEKKTNKKTVPEVHPQSGNQLLPPPDIAIDIARTLH